MPLNGHELKELIGDLMVTIAELRKELQSEQGKVRELAEKLEEILTKTETT